MRLPIFATFALLTPLAVAQNFNDVKRNAEPYLWTQGAHVNGNAYPDTRANPTQHSQTGQTVPQGTLVYRVLPAYANSRFEPREISGFRVSIAPSSATVIYPNTNIQVPEIKIHPTTLQGTTLVPDTTQPALYTMPASPGTFGSFGFFWLSANLQATATIPAGPANNDIAVSIMYNQNDNRDVVDTLMHWGSAFELQIPEPQFGFVDAAGAITLGVNTSSSGTCSSITIKEDKPVINVFSDWGIDPQGPAQSPPAVGYGPATYFSTLASKSGTLGFEVLAENQDGDLAIPLLNVGTQFQGGIPFLGETIELLVADPLFAVLTGLGAPISNGELSIQITFPVVAPLKGFKIGLEWVLIDVAGLALNGSTQAVWVTI